jgi:hypothetical protein
MTKRKEWRPTIETVEEWQEWLKRILGTFSNIKV